MIRKFAIGFAVSLLTATLSFGDDFTAIYKRLNPSVVTIQTTELVRNRGRITQRRAVASGVLVDKAGSIMTAAHVVHTADRIVVQFTDGKKYEAEVVSSVPTSDLALIRLKSPPNKLTVAKLGDSDSVEVGQTALVIGAPFGLRHSLSVGHISGKQVRDTLAGGERLELLQTDAAINHGNSGGPIFNDKGEVIGIVSHILSEGGGSDGIGFAIAINIAKKILLEDPSFWTGFEGMVLPRELARILNVPQQSGVLIQRVTKGSIADRAGIRGGKLKMSFLGQEIWFGGDIILSIQGITCDTPHNFTKIKHRIEMLKPQESLTLIALRAGEQITLKIQAIK